MLMKIAGIFLKIDGLTGIVTIIIYAFRFRKYKKNWKQARWKSLDEAPEAVGTEAQNSGTAEASSDNEGAGSTAEEETDVPSSDITAADAAEDTAAAADSMQAAGQMAVPPTAPMGNNLIRIPAPDQKIIHSSCFRASVKKAFSEGRYVWSGACITATNIKIRLELKQHGWKNVRMTAKPAARIVRAGIQKSIEAPNANSEIGKVIGIVSGKGVSEIP